MRRRRRGPETYTLALCSVFQDVWRESTCLNPTVYATTLFVPTPPVGSSDPTTAGAVIGQKGPTVLGIKFASEFYHDSNLDNIDQECPSPNPQIAVFQLRIWEALVVLPLAQGSKTIPAYLPNLTNNTQQFDLADRVLWKRLRHLPIFGFATANGLNQWSTTFYDSANAGPQVVKSKVFLGDHQGLFYVRNFVHDYVVPAHDPEQCAIFIGMDSWFKVFYRSRF